MTEQIANGKEEPKEEPKEAKETTQEQNGNTEAESKARAMGWRPKEEFRGDPALWRSADDFLKYGEEAVPMLKKELREVKGMLRDVVLSQKAQTERAVQEAIEALQRERSNAILEADLEKVNKIDDQIEKKRQAVNQQAAKPPISQEIEEWGSKNTWFNEDEEMRGFAIGVFERQVKAGRSDSDALEAVNKRVREVFPSKFGNPRRSEPSSVEGGTTKKAKTIKGWEDLPHDIKPIAEGLVKKGILTKEEYLKNYQW